MQHITIINSTRSDFFLAKNKPTFSRGFRGILSFNNLTEEYKAYLEEDKEQADARAIYLDWVAVGNDIKKGIELYERTKS